MIVSRVPVPQWGQLGVSDLLILCRTVLIRRCCVRIWISALACGLFSCPIMWMKLSEGME